MHTIKTNLYAAAPFLSDWGGTKNGHSALIEDIWMQDPDGNEGDGILYGYGYVIFNPNGTIRDCGIKRVQPLDDSHEHCYHAIGDNHFMRDTGDGIECELADYQGTSVVIEAIAG